ncbi:hypothetical protein EDC18_106127 [Natranaerovirga pectinivora]|uniref:Uncharacterized protein n=1 Tax=Natranaerovirga pectinivora TaxID=682400 RepID=A0A4R3MNR8_9FIRM|nr:hypothetical protein [Natranaerovirga pectinivora]TCT14329.1 hypothetical protein EDC18_106127 [Natranaerovirga pectinivora]
MKMTKLGISTGLLSSICFFFAYYSIWVGTALMLAVIVLNLNNTVKRNAIQGVVTFGSLIILKSIYDRFFWLIDRFTRGTNTFNIWFNEVYRWFLLVIVLYCIINAIKEKIVYIPIVSDFVNKNIDDLD